MSPPFYLGWDLLSPDWCRGTYFVFLTSPEGSLLGTEYSSPTNPLCPNQRDLSKQITAEHWKNLLLLQRQTTKSFRKELSKAFWWMNLSQCTYHGYLMTNYGDSIKLMCWINEKCSCFYYRFACIFRSDSQSPFWRISPSVHTCACTNLHLWRWGLLDSDWFMK